MPYIERYLFIFMNRQRALPEQKRYLLHCVQPYRTPKEVRERNEIESGTGTRRIRKYTKATRDVSQSKAARGLAALRKVQGEPYSR